MQNMKVLWVCNTILPAIAEHFNLQATNKEGWLSGLCDVIMKKQKENGIELALAFPVPRHNWIWQKKVQVGEGEVTCFGFYEDTAHPESYDGRLEMQFLVVVECFHPDVIHCFGTEYSHTCAICENFSDKSRLLISIQGLCSVYANAYFASGFHAFV